MASKRDATPIGQIALTPADGTHEKAKSMVKVAAIATIAVPATATESYLFMLSVSVGEQGFISDVVVSPGHSTLLGATINVTMPDKGAVEAVSGLKAEGLTTGKNFDLDKKTNKYPIGP